VTVPALRAEGLARAFAGVRALDDVSLELAAGEVLGVVGENGAGKSTLLKVLAGVCRPDRGRIVVRGRPVRFDGPRDAAAAGIGMVFQEQSLLPDLSVAENVMLGREGGAVRAGFYDWKRLRAAAAVQLAKLGSDISPRARTGSLSLAERQVVELAKVLTMEEGLGVAPILLLDEPTAALDAAGSRLALALVARLRRHAAVVFVSHDLDDVLRLSDRVAVLAEGRCVALRACGGCTVADLRALMLAHARPAPPVAPRAGAASAGPVVLAVRGLGDGGHYRDVAFEVRAGEVLAIAGAAGSGREPLLRALCGAAAPDAGEIVVDGRPVRFAEPADAVARGIGCVPADRAAEGILAGWSVGENMTLAHLDEVRRGPFVDRGRERALATRWIERLGIRPASPRLQAQRLSGGNQQKLLLARWLAGRALRALILEQPLRGLDVGAQAEVVAAIRALAQRGVAVVLATDVLAELLALGDSFLVMRRGAVAAAFAAGAARPAERELLEQAC
jgi:ribose transport system ATP-binding protein